MEHSAAHFSVSCSRFIDEAGKAVGDLPDWTREPSSLTTLYRDMVLARTFDTKAVALQRTGRLGTFASSLGQEAVSIGATRPMRRDDVFVPSFREHGGQLVRGVSLKELFLYWGGDERGSDFKEAREDLPVSIPVGSHAPHAAGVALAFKLRQEPRVAVCVFGDGATSKGDVYEAWNAAGLWELPVVFIVNNNQWAISVRRRDQTAAKTLAQKAIAAGIPGCQVDGNDVVAVYDAVDQSVRRAREGAGPTVIEALTYRLGDHTTADDARRYRDEAEVSHHWKEDPITRLRAYLAAAGDWDKDKEEALLTSTSEAVNAATEAYLATEPEPPAAMFDYLYANLPEAYAEQRDAVTGSSIA